MSQSGWRSMGTPGGACPTRAEVPEDPLPDFGPCIVRSELKLQNLHRARGM